MHNLVMWEFNSAVVFLKDCFGCKKILHICINVGFKNINHLTKITSVSLSIFEELYCLATLIFIKMLLVLNIGRFILISAFCTFSIK